MNLEYRSEHAQYLECYLVCEVVFAAPDIPVLNSLCLSISFVKFHLELQFLTVSRYHSSIFIPVQNI